MTNYTREEIKEGAAKIDRLSEQLIQAAHDLTDNEHVSDEMLQELDAAVNRLIALGWDICFPPAELQGVYGDLSHLWTIEQTQH